MKKTKITYSEPASYFPDSVMKKNGLGKYADKDKKKATATTKKVKRK